jgi:1,4-alpha-glucan branching enzyme
MKSEVIEAVGTQGLPSTKTTVNRSRTRAATETFDLRKEVFFELDANAAKEVLLAGDFTNWEKKPIKLRKAEHGAWFATVRLAPGVHHYKFVVDGKWQTDPCAAANCPNSYGTCDSIVKIS